MDTNKLKIISIVGTVLGLIVTIVSNYADSKQREMEIDEKVEERFNRYLAEKGENTLWKSMTQS